MFQRAIDSYSNPVKARQYRLAALIVATTAFTVIAVGNAIDPPVPGSGQQEEDALGILLVLGESLPLVLVFRWPMLSLVLIITPFAVHAGFDYEVIWVAQFTVLISSLKQEDWLPLCGIQSTG